MTSLALARALRDERHGRLDMLPYARLLDLRFEQDDDEVRLVMPFTEALVGAPGRIHGGALAGLLEIAGLAAVIVAQPDADRMPRIRPVTVTVDFMREGTPRDTFAAAEVTRLGRRIVNVSARAWQFERSRPIAAAHLNFLLDWPEAAGAEQAGRSASGVGFPSKLASMGPDWGRQPQTPIDQSLGAVA